MAFAKYASLSDAGTDAAMLSQTNTLRMWYRCMRYRFKSEVPSISFVRNADLAGRTLLDIGAHRGIYSIYLSRAAGEHGRVIAFEPQPELHEHLCVVKRRFGLCNLTIANVGLSSRRGTLTLRRSYAGSGGASFYVEPSPELEAIAAPVVPLDEYVEAAGVKAVDFIKCDVEGHEWEVFEGAERTLRRCTPTLLFECRHETAVAGRLFGFLSELGYDGYFYHVSSADHRSWFNKNRGAYVRCEEAARHEYPRSSVIVRNYLFVPRGVVPDAVHYGREPRAGERLAAPSRS